MRSVRVSPTGAGARVIVVSHTVSAQQVLDAMNMFYVGRPLIAALFAFTLTVAFHSAAAAQTGAGESFNVANSTATAAKPAATPTPAPPQQQQAPSSKAPKQLKL